MKSLTEATELTEGVESESKSDTLAGFSHCTVLRLQVSCWDRGTSSNLSQKKWFKTDNTGG